MNPDARHAPLTPRWEWKRIANFTSRTTRGEFWAAWGLGLAASFAGAILDALVAPDTSMFIFIGIAIWIWLSWGASVNRFHDMGMSGWYFLLFLIPIVNVGVHLYLGFEKGEPTINKWGPPVGGRTSGAHSSDHPADEEPTMGAQGVAQGQGWRASHPELDLVLVGAIVAALLVAGVYLVNPRLQLSDTESVWCGRHQASVITTAQDLGLELNDAVHSSRERYDRWLDTIDGKRACKAAHASVVEVGS